MKEFTFKSVLSSSLNIANCKTLRRVSSLKVRVLVRAGRSHLAVQTNQTPLSSLSTNHWPGPPTPSDTLRGQHNDYIQRHFLREAFNRTRKPNGCFCLSSLLFVSLSPLSGGSDHGVGVSSKYVEEMSGPDVLEVWGFY